MFIEFIKKNTWILYLIPLLLLMPALLINLGILPFILDESTRGQVALEMIISHNYITPTINSEFYLNKPPLFNWIIAGFINLTGNTSEFTFRLPMIISLLFFGLTIYISLWKRYGKRFALLVAIMVITSGRILFYDSLRGLIDITFSWMIFTSFMVIYHFYFRNKYLLLFIFSYFIISLGFLLKGLPALVFQGITLLTFFAYQRQLRKLFSFAHLIGILILFLIVGGYLYMYNKHFPLSDYFTNLWTESSKRTAIDNKFISTLKHVFTFPVEFITHFLPWTLLILCCFRKNTMKMIHGEPLLKFSFYIFLANIIVYWLSPAIYARYLFMFLPLVFFILLYFYNTEEILVKKIIQVIFLIVGLAVVVLSASIPFIDRLAIQPHIYLKCSLLFIVSGLIVFLFICIKEHRLILLVSILLIARIGFNWFILPDRLREGNDEIRRTGPIELAKHVQNEKLYIYKDTKIHNVESFYITRERMQLLSRKYENFDDGAYYIMQNDSVSNAMHDRFSYKKDYGMLKLVKFKQED